MEQQAKRGTATGEQLSRWLDWIGKMWNIMFQSCVFSPYMYIAWAQCLFDTDTALWRYDAESNIRHTCPQCWQPTQYSHAGGPGADPEEKWRRSLSSIANRSFQWFGGNSCLQCRSKVQTEEMVGKEGMYLGCTSATVICLPGHPHAVIVSAMFEIKLLASTAQFYCSQFCQRKDNNIKQSVQLQGKNKKSSSSSQPPPLPWSSW